MVVYILSVLGPALETLAGKSGAFAQILMIIGMARLFMKPIMVAIGEIVKITPSAKDDAFIAKILANPWYKGVCFVLDFLLSIKLPKARK
jgi:hypothetical protein